MQQLQKNKSVLNAKTVRRKWRENLLESHQQNCRFGLTMLRTNLKRVAKGIAISFAAAATL